MSLINTRMLSFVSVTFCSIVANATFAQKQVSTESPNAIHEDKQTDVSRPNSKALNIAMEEGIEALYGKWEAGGRAGEAIYGLMEISKSKITWKGKSNSNPRCTVTYKQVSKSDEIQFQSEPDHFRNISPFKSYVVSIHGRCALKVTHFRLTLPSNLPGYLDMLEYYGERKDAGGYLHFHKHANHIHQ